MPLPYVKYFILQVTRIRWWPGNEGTLERSIQFYLLTGALSWLPSDGKISLSGRYFFIKATILSRIYSCHELEERLIHIAITKAKQLYFLSLPGLLWTGSIHCEVASLQSSTPSQTELGMEALHNEL